jgi:hypothetical protein
VQVWPLLSVVVSVEVRLYNLLEISVCSFTYRRLISLPMNSGGSRNAGSRPVLSNRPQYAVSQKTQTPMPLHGRGGPPPSHRHSILPHSNMNVQRPKQATIAPNPPRPPPQSRNFPRHEVHPPGPLQ